MQEHDAPKHDLNGDHNLSHLTPNPSDANQQSPRSPPTPVSNIPVSDMKIDVDYEQQESDARSEPLPPRPDLHDASVVPQLGSPVDPNSIPIDPPKEDDVVNYVNGVNGVHAQDAVMTDVDDHTPAATPAPSASYTADSLGASTSHTTPNDADDDEDKPPPAKRARVYSDADRASMANSSTPPPPSTAASVDVTPVPPTAGPSSLTAATPATTLSVGQYRFCQSTVRTLKKLKDAQPFLKPVDPVALNVPHYPQIIKNPMDFSTIERKLTASNPVKPDPNPQNPRYYTADDFIADVRLIMSNCITFNGPDHVITQMGKRVEEVFDKQIKNLPPAEQPKAPPVKKQSTPPVPPPPAPPKKTQPARRPSTSVPVIRRSDVPEAVGRPKREIHPPPPKDLPYVDAPKKPRKAKGGKDITSEQLKYCGKILADLHKKQHYTIANPFYEPVDWQKLEIPAYPRIIKKPMDLSTIRRKLEAGEYPNAQKFYDDFKLMIRNCFTFNPAGTPVNQAGSELQRLFDEKWKHLPSPVNNEPSDEEDDDEDDSEDDRARTIAMMESQIESMRGTISALKNAKVGKDKKKKKEKEKAPAPAASTSKAPPKPPKATASSSSSKKKSKKTALDDDVMSFEQKKELSEAIAKLDGTKLERVIQIIHEGVPEIRDSTEEIELEIDLLPVPVLMKLYNFVIRPMRPQPPKRNRPGKGTGTGGLKRKSMDEDVEAEKIRQLEQRMALFDQGANGVAAPAAARAHDSDHSSDSSSDDSSGSDSD
ncbi:Bromodomain-containing protein [Dendrothele bispora CBS 962.96]|uniref:Bromodomain-containing protein n=1 Tax=Dendrothele bispora (strain CBS 962.96) TaxID=1314807 RepID=A0A4S8MSW0_DENBC|nr:Bromodomain-containing protein [Dendrothele bispora CBS 962.96]